MNNSITRIAIFEPRDIGSWRFRVSISNLENILIICYDMMDHSNFHIRFFTNEDEANAFVIEASQGKHS